MLGCNSIIVNILLDFGSGFHALFSSGVRAFPYAFTFMLGYISMNFFFM